MRNRREERSGLKIIMPNTMKSTITKPAWLVFIKLALMIKRIRWWPQNRKPLGARRFYFYEADSVRYAVQKFHSSYVREDHSTTLSIRGSGESCRQAHLRWRHQLKIPVLYTGELDSFLGCRRNGEIVEPSSDKVEQYEMFLIQLLEFKPSFILI